MSIDQNAKPVKKAGWPSFKFKLDPSVIKKNYVWILLGALLLVLLLAKTTGQIKNIIQGGKEPKEKKMTEFAESVPVKAYKVKKMDFKDTLPVMGRIEGNREIELRFESSGIVESFNFEEGERILEGDIIASLNQKDALLKLKYATLEAEKAKKLYQLGGYDKLAYDQKNLEYESAKRDLEKTNIYAASDGYLGAKDKSVGSYVTSQDKVGVFVDYSSVNAVFDVIEEDSSKIKLGQNVDVFLDAYPSQTFPGTIDMISPMIEGRTRTQKMKVELKNKDNMMKPGMFARAVVNTYEKKDALIIPASAFKKKEQQYFVYVLHRDEPSEGLEEEEEEAPGKGGEAKPGKNAKPGKSVKEEPRDEEEEEADIPVVKNSKKDLMAGPVGDESQPEKKEPKRTLVEDELGTDSEAVVEMPVPQAPAKGKRSEKEDEEIKKQVEEVMGEMEAKKAGEKKEGKEGEEAADMATVEEREIKVEYLTHDMAEIGEGLKEGEMIIRELHQEFKDKDKVEITEVQETIF